MYTYKKYAKEVITNEHSLLELKFNISDAILLGSGDSVQSMTEVISKYQLQFNNKKLMYDAFEKCKSNDVCSKVVDEPDSEILNYLYADAYSTLSEESMTNEEWE